MAKIILLVLTVTVLSTACAVQRPISSPDRPDDRTHRQAKTVKQCLKCHEYTVPHYPNRGDCLKCHLVSGKE